MVTNTMREELQPEISAVWVRMPYRGVCRYTGLGRSKMTALIRSPKRGEKPPVRSVLLREPGAKRGVRLVHLPSLLSYLDSLSLQQVTNTSEDVL